MGETALPEKHSIFVIKYIWGREKFLGLTSAQFGFREEECLGVSKDEYFRKFVTGTEVLAGQAYADNIMQTMRRAEDRGIYFWLKSCLLLYVRWRIGNA